MANEKTVAVSGPALGAVALGLLLLGVYEAPEVLCTVMKNDSDERVRMYGFRMEAALLREKLKQGESISAKKLADELAKAKEGNDEREEH